MPQPFERNDVIASLKIVRRAKGSLYTCRCYVCKRLTTVAASSLRRKKVDCRTCFPKRRQPRHEVVFSKRGYALLEEPAA